MYNNIFFIWKLFLKKLNLKIHQVYEYLIVFWLYIFLSTGLVKRSGLAFIFYIFEWPSGHDFSDAFQIFFRSDSNKDATVMAILSLTCTPCNGPLWKRTFWPRTSFEIVLQRDDWSFQSLSVCIFTKR